jgi:hypothetical protein
MNEGIELRYFYEEEVMKPLSKPEMDENLDKFGIPVQEFGNRQVTREFALYQHLNDFGAPIQEFGNRQVTREFALYQSCAAPKSQQKMQVAVLAK